MQKLINRIVAFSVAAGFAVIAQVASAETKDNAYYFSIGTNVARSQLNSMTFENPRITGKVDGPTKDSHATASLAVGKSFGNGWRGDIEYVLPSKTEYSSHWAPFPTFEQKVKVNSSRLMVNAYKDFAISNKLSLYGTVGLGWANVKTSGAQSSVPGGPADNPFASNTKDNLAYSFGGGAEFKLDQKSSINLGLRRVEMGNVQSGISQFLPNDERYKGKLTSDEVLIDWKYSF